MQKNEFDWPKRIILIVALLVMLAVCVAGGVGTYSNISGVYGQGTALGALAAGEGATAVLALVMLVLTMFGQSSPLVIRVGLWALPAAASVIGAMAATEGPGQTIIYAATPMAITAGAEGLAFLVRRAVVHQEGRDIESQARAAAVIRDLAYHQARAVAHPSKGARKRSVRRSWRLARKVGHGDTELGMQLLDVQRSRLTQGADTALARMFQPGIEAAELPALPPVATPEAGTVGTVRTEGTDPEIAHRADPGTDAGNTSVQVVDPVMPALARLMPADPIADPAATDAPERATAPQPLAAAGNRSPEAGKPGQEMGKPSTPELPAAGKPLGKPRSVSMAQAVRELRSMGITDDDRIIAKVPELLGREVKESSIRRENRRQRPASAPTTQDGAGPYL